MYWCYFPLKCFKFQVVNNSERWIIERKKYCYDYEAFQNRYVGYDNTEIMQQDAPNRHIMSSSQMLCRRTKYEFKEITSSSRGCLIPDILFHTRTIPKGVTLLTTPQRSPSTPKKHFNTPGLKLLAAWFLISSLLVITSSLHSGFDLQRPAVSTAGTAL